MHSGLDAIVFIPAPPEDTRTLSIQLSEMLEAPQTPHLFPAPTAVQSLDRHSSLSTASSTFSLFLRQAIVVINAILPPDYRFLRAAASLRVSLDLGSWKTDSYTAFYHRRLIALFLSGDLYDRMDDKGKNMFPMNGKCEAIVLRK